jgi:hypothetical protein
VKVRAGERTATVFAPEASGSPDIPVTDAAIGEKFLGLVAPAIGDRAAADWLRALWAIGEAQDAGRVLLGRDVR